MAPPNGAGWRSLKDDPPATEDIYHIDWRHRGEGELKEIHRKIEEALGDAAAPSSPEEGEDGE